MWPMVQPAPMVSGKPMSVWQTQLSCTFEPSPTTIGSLSPRSTALNQTEAPPREHDPPDQPRAGRHPEVAVRRQLRRDPVERVEAHFSRSSNSAFSRRTSSDQLRPAVAAQPLGGDDRAELLLALREVGVDQHVVVFGPVADLVARLRHARRDHARRVLAAGAQPALQLGDRRRQDEDRDHRVAQAASCGSAGRPASRRRRARPGRRRSPPRPARAACRRGCRRPRRARASRPPRPSPRTRGGS